MNVIEFCDEYNKRNEQMQATFVKSIIKRRYVPIMEKMTMCRVMAEKSIMKNENGISSLNTIINKLDFVSGIIMLYTNLEYTKNTDGNAEIAKCYDALCESGALNKIMDEIGPDIEELLLVNKDCLDNIFNENCSTEAFVAKQVDKFSLIISGLKNVVIETIKEELKDPGKVEAIIKSLSL